MAAKRRLALWLVTGLIGLLLVVAGSALFLVATETGARIVVDVVLPRLPASVALSVADARGRLLGPLQLNGVRLEVAGVGLTVEQADLTWHPRALLGRRLVIEQLTVTGLAIVIDTTASDTSDVSPETASDSAGVQLPFPIEFGRVVVDPHVDPSEVVRDVVDLRGGGMLPAETFHAAVQVGTTIVEDQPRHSRFFHHRFQFAIDQLGVGLRHRFDVQWLSEPLREP